MALGKIKYKQAIRQEVTVPKVIFMTIFCACLQDAIIKHFPTNPGNKYEDCKLQYDTKIIYPNVCYSFCYV